MVVQAPPLYRIELSQGEDKTVDLDLKKPDGTAVNLTGATIVAQVKDAVNQLVSNFGVTVIDAIAGKIELTLAFSQTTHAGVYYCDVKVQTLTNVSLIPIGEVIIRRSVSGASSSGSIGGGTSIDPAITAAIAAAIATHNANLNAHPGLQAGGGNVANYERTFNQANLTIANLLVVTHNLHTIPSGVAIFDAGGDQIIPDKITFLSTDSIAIDFSSFAPIAGTWQLSIGV